MANARVHGEERMKTLVTVASMLITSAWMAACTTNVENPTVNQQGRGGNEVCVMDCDAANVTCVAKCTDDKCKASCEATHSSCTGSCAPTDGG